MRRGSSEDAIVEALMHQYHNQGRHRSGSIGMIILLAVGLAVAIIGLFLHYSSSTLQSPALQTDFQPAPQTVDPGAWSYATLVYEGNLQAPEWRQSSDGSLDISVLSFADPKVCQESGFVDMQVPISGSVYLTTTSPASAMISIFPVDPASPGTTRVVIVCQPGEVFILRW